MPAPTTTETPPTGAVPPRSTIASASTGPLGRLLIALGVVVVAALVLVAADGAARPAAAEAPAGDTESVVVAMDPTTPAIDLRVLGGDETMRLEVQPGHEVVVPGYAGEPYLRIDPRGDVFENRRSPAVTANLDRYSTQAPVASQDPSAEPAWALIGRGGRAEWHDHRVHWMAESLPVPGEPGDVVFEWTLDLTVDGRPVAVDGELRRGKAGPTWPWFVLMALTASQTVLAGRGRLRATVVVAGAALVTALAAASVIGERMALECWWCGRVLEVAPVAVALVAIASLAVVRTAGARLIAATVALVALVGWLLVHLRVVTRPVVVSAWPEPVARALIAIAIGLAAGALVLAALEGRQALEHHASRSPASHRQAARARRRRAATPKG